MEISFQHDFANSPENMRWIAQELLDHSNEAARVVQEQIDALGGEDMDISRRLHRLFETIEAGAGLSLDDVGPRIRQLRARQKEIKAQVERLDAHRPDVPAVTIAQAMRAASYFREAVTTCGSPAKVREFLGHIVKKASIHDHEAVVDYWPERLVAASGGSHCVVSWLPDLATLRTVRVRVMLPCRTGRKAA